MEDVLMKAKEYWAVAAGRADAHERSAEWHRYRGTTLGVATTALSAVVSTAIFTTVMSQLGLNKNGTITIPQNGWALLILIVLSLLLVLSPVLSGVQTYLNDPEQADRHRGSWAGYYRVQQRIDIFLLRYAGANVTAETKEKALKELGEVSGEIADLCQKSITLTRSAFADPEKKSRCKLWLWLSHPRSNSPTK